MNLPAAGDLLRTLSTLASYPAGPVIRCTTRQNDECFRLVDRLTGEPLRDEPYRITTPSAVIEGVTDDNGMTVRVSTGERIEQLGFERLPRQFPFADMADDEPGCL